MTGQTKSGSRASNEKIKNKEDYIAHGARLGTTRKSDVGLQVGPSPAGGMREGQCIGIWVAVVGRGPRRPNPWTLNLAMGTWNVTSLGGKEPELVWGVDRCQREIIGLTSTHSLASGTQLL